MTTRARLAWGVAAGAWLGSVFGEANDHAVMLAVILAVLSPWTLRNKAVLGKAYLVSSNFSANLWMGNNPESTGGYMPTPPEVKAMSEVEREERAVRTADRAVDLGALGPVQFVVEKTDETADDGDRMLDAPPDESGLAKIGFDPHRDDEEDQWIERRGCACKAESDHSGS